MGEFKIPVCSMCKDPEKDSLIRNEDWGWACDECLTDMELYDRVCEDYEERKRRRMQEANEY